MSGSSQNLIGSAMIIGGGIAGVQAALDLADTGHMVYLVEKSEAIGGVMSALDKTFPTNDCSMCILSPKLVECGRHPNIEILTLTEVLDAQGEAGDFTIKLKRKARYVDMDKCIACGLCAEKCPRKVPDEYNQGLGTRKAAFVKYPQAVPLKYAIDKDNCIFFQKGKCRACEKFCPAGAINFDDQDREFTLEVGSVILAPGFETFDPLAFDTYNYGKFPNVITSMEFERILSPSGPYQGDLVRPSDSTEPQRIAWLQCVGSRDVSHCGNGHCSAVCCMYAIKEAVIAKEHSHIPLDAAIFFMHMRTSGKEFEKYYDRARDEHGVRFIRSRIPTIRQAEGSDNLLIQYISEDGVRHEEEFDLVVLSVGLQTSPEVVELAGKLGVEVNEGRFAATSPFEPVTTSRPGIFVCGAFQGPKDIPQSVMEASAAAAETAALLSPVRGTAVGKPPELTEMDRAGVNPPRVGVFVCRCGINIASVVDVPAVRTYAKTLPNVAYVEESLFTCSQNTQEKMKEAIREHGLNRIVVASCSPRTHEPLFQQTIREAGLNKYLFELANIRDQNSWVHQDFPEAATEKAKDLVRMAVARVTLQEPLDEIRLSITKSGLVVGGGVAGMEAALAIANQGYPATLVEKSAELGGHARKLLSTWNGEPVWPYLDALVKKVNEHPQITVHTNAVLKEVKGFVGNFTSALDVNGKEENVEYGVAVIATGADSYRPTEYRYGESDRVMLNPDLDEALQNKDKTVMGARSAAFIQCVGSREPDRPYCSRVCCSHSIRNAIHLKELNPAMNVYILYRDIRTYGMMESIYREARQKGVIFLRFDLAKKPLVEIEGNALKVTTFDCSLQRHIALDVDVLVLAGSIETRDAGKLAQMFKVPLNPEGFFLEAHMKLRPVDFATDGVYVAGLAHYPKPIEESIAQAKAAASRAATVLARDFIAAGGVAASVNQDLCSGCQACVKCCPFGAINYLEQEAKCAVNQALCKGCGTCAATCPSEAISLMGFSNMQLYTQIDQALAD